MKVLGDLARRDRAVARHHPGGRGDNDDLAALDSRLEMRAFLLAGADGHFHLFVDDTLEESGAERGAAAVGDVMMMTASLR